MCPREPWGRILVRRRLPFEPHSKRFFEKPTTVFPKAVAEKDAAARREGEVPADVALATSRTIAMEQRSRCVLIGGRNAAMTNT